MYRTIGIMGALPEEVELISKALREPACESYAGTDYHFGNFCGRRLFVCCAGMGKVNAASAAQVLITKYGADTLIFCGIAGNTSHEIGIGDMVISRELCHHDAEDRMLRQSAPFTSVYKADERLIHAAEQACRRTGVRYIVGRIATGEQFVGDAAQKAAIVKKCAPSCVEMEGAAIAQVAMRSGIPFVVLRAMSDDADQTAEALGAEAFDVSEYVKTSSAIVLAAIESLQ